MLGGIDLTDQNKDKGLPKSSSFKEKILAELEEASRARKQMQTDHLEKEVSTSEAEAVVAELNLQTSKDNVSSENEITDVIWDESFVEEELQEPSLEQVIQEDDENLTETVSIIEFEETTVEEVVPEPETESVSEGVTESFIELDEVAEDEEPAPQVESELEDINLEETLIFEKRLVDIQVPTQEFLETKELNEEKVVGSSDLSLDTSVEELENEEPLVAWQSKEPVLEPRLASARVTSKDMGRQGRQRTNRVAAKISTVFASVIAILILLLGLLGFFYVSSSIGPLDKTATDYVQVEIPAGSGNKLIGQILKENGVIRDANIFNFYTKFKNYSNFQSGYYNFQKSMSLDQIAKYLQDGGTAEPQRPVLGKVTIPEGYTIKQIAKAIALNTNTEDATDKTIFNSEEFLELVQDESFIAKMIEKYPGLLGNLPDASVVTYRLEGYLFPATYDYYEETTLEDFVEQMIAAADANLSPYYSQIANMGMTVNDILTMASLVEKEGATDDDREMIASVFYNRINTGMPLQSNIAILYAMDKLGEKTTLAEDAGIDTGIDSPYNIYQNPGLMPGPVDSPSLSAILASINPASSNYLYFVADVTTGVVYFSETFEEHSAYVEEHVNSKLN